MSAVANEVALVTGGASGIGRAVVERFVAEGYRVGVADVDTKGLATLAESLGERVVTVEADIATIEATRPPYREPSRRSGSSTYSSATRAFSTASWSSPICRSRAFTTATSRS